MLRSFVRQQDNGLSCSAYDGIHHRGVHANQYGGHRQTDQQSSSKIRKHFSPPGTCDTERHLRNAAFCFVQAKISTPLVVRPQVLFISRKKFFAPHVPCPAFVLPPCPGVRAAGYSGFMHAAPWRLCRSRPHDLCLEIRMGLAAACRNFRASGFAGNGLRRRSGHAPRTMSLSTADRCLCT